MSKWQQLRGGLVGEDGEWAALVLYPGGLEMLNQVEEILARHCAPSATGHASSSGEGRWGRVNVILQT